MRDPCFNLNKICGLISLNITAFEFEIEQNVIWIREKWILECLNFGKCRERFLTVEFWDVKMKYIWRREKEMRGKKAKGFVLNSNFINF